MGEADRGGTSGDAGEVARTVQRALAELTRTGQLTIDRVLAICDRRGLDGRAAAAVQAELVQMGVLSGGAAAPVEGFEQTYGRESYAGWDVDGMTLYLSAIAAHPLLSAEDERTLGRRIEMGDAALDELYELLDQVGGDRSRLPEIIDPKGLGHLRRMVRDGERARWQLYESNLRLVVSIARRYRPTGMELLDLVQEGNLGLIRAVEKFDYTKGFKFSTYATWWIRQAVTRGIADKSRMIRLPVHFLDQIKRVQRCRYALRQQLEREPTLAELAAQSDMDPAKIQFCLDWFEDAISLDQPIGDGTILGDMVEDRAAPGPEANALSQDRAARLAEVVDGLDDREREVIHLRFGLDGDQAQTLEEVGRQFGVTRERIRQIEKRALTKLANASQLADFRTVRPPTEETLECRSGGDEELHADPRAPIGVAESTTGSPSSTLAESSEQASEVGSESAAGQDSGECVPQIGTNPSTDSSESRSDSGLGRQPAQLTLSVDASADPRTARAHYRTFGLSTGSEMIGNETSRESDASTDGSDEAAGEVDARRRSEPAAGPRQQKPGKSEKTTRKPKKKITRDREKGPDRKETEEEQQQQKQQKKKKKKRSK